MSLNIDALLSLEGLDTSALDFGDAEFKVRLSQLFRLTNGTGASQIDQLFTDQRTIAASGNEDLDIATGGGLLNAFGGAIAMARMKGLLVVADAGNTNNVQVTRPAANGVPWMLAAGDGFELAPGEGCMFVWPGATAKVVTAATADLINFANSGAGTSVTYKVAIFGASA